MPTNNSNKLVHVACACCLLLSTLQCHIIDRDFFTMGCHFICLADTVTLNFG
ncbi:hypothetical protein CIPAW_11G101600 [Carya illinoinensis]|uniref:Uncharacterized protein n=1 Tax=Carya illinoinensis TaxID=32201 RepID=A0A8T1P5Y2_CARIL|nr:hypothetical protein CIPAW_11G101600 [Carya illinoinensis]